MAVILFSTYRLVRVVWKKKTICEKGPASAAAVVVPGLKGEVTITIMVTGCL